MDVNVAESGPCRRTVSIKIPADQVRAHIDQVYDSASQQVSLKGFRKGKVPRRVLEQKYGDAILAEAKESLVNRSLQDALREHSLSPLGRPNLEGIDESPLRGDADVEFQVSFEIRPTFEIGRTKGLPTTKGETEVTDEDVDNALGRLAHERRTLQSVDEPAADGDFVKVDMAFVSEAGETVSERKGVQLNTQIPIAGTDPETFAAKLRGAEKGQSLEIDLEFPDTFETESVRGQKGSVKLEVLDVLRVVPAPIDEELAKSFDFESVEAMREDLTRRLGEEKKRADLVRQEEELINALLAENAFDLPQGMVDEQAEHSLAEFRERMKRGGVEEAEIESKIEEARPEAREDAERRARAFFLLEAVARKEKLFVTESDVEAEIRRVALENQVSPQEVREYYEQRNMLADVRLGLMERKVRDFLREHAELTD